jgi:hypothetical protein
MPTLAPTESPSKGRSRSRSGRSSSRTPRRRRRSSNGSIASASTSTSRRIRGLHPNAIPTNRGAAPHRGRRASSQPPRCRTTSSPPASRPQHRARRPSRSAQHESEPAVRTCESSSAGSSRSSAPTPAPRSSRPGESWGSGRACGWMPSGSHTSADGWRDPVRRGATGTGRHEQPAARATSREVRAISGMKTLRRTGRRSGAGSTERCKEAQTSPRRLRMVELKAMARTRKLSAVRSEQICEPNEETLRPHENS